MVLKIKVADLSPVHFSEKKPQMVPMDLNIGFQGLALIQGQIDNPENGCVSRIALQTNKSIN